MVIKPHVLQIDAILHFCLYGRHRKALPEMLPQVVYFLVYSNQTCHAQPHLRGGVHAFAKGILPIYQLLYQQA